MTFILNKAASFGFKTWDIDRKVGIVEFGEGEELLGIFTHIDVVPPGNIEDWKFHPFEGVIHDGRIWGRGTLDDKGPTIAVLYSMKRLKDAGFKPSKRVRLVIGTDEESSWECIKTYKAVEEEPTIGFTPDGCFPVTHSEKGIVYVKLTFPEVLDTSLTSINAGIAANVIPEEAKAWIRNPQDHPIENIQSEISYDHHNIILNAKKSSESDALPTLIYDLQRTLLKNDGMQPILSEIINKILDPTGENAKLNFSDDVSGNLSLNPTIIKFENNQLECTINIRYPSSLEPEFILKKITNSFNQLPASYEILSHRNPVYYPENTDFIQSFLSIYRNIMYDDTKPASISGGTYARAFSNTIAFGALFPTEPLNAHQIDESVSLKAVYNWLRVYESAIKRLSK